MIAWVSVARFTVPPPSLVSATFHTEHTSTHLSGSRHLAWRGRAPPLLPPLEGGCKQPIGLRAAPAWRPQTGAGRLHGQAAASSLGSAEQVVLLCCRHPQPFRPTVSNVALPGLYPTRPVHGSHLRAPMRNCTGPGRSGAAPRQGSPRPACKGCRMPGSAPLLISMTAAHMCNRTIAWQRRVHRHALDQKQRVASRQPGLLTQRMWGGARPCSSPGQPLPKSSTRSRAAAPAWPAGWQSSAHLQ